MKCICINNLLYSEYSHIPLEYLFMPDQVILEKGKEYIVKEEDSRYKIECIIQHSNSNQSNRQLIPNMIFVDINENNFNRLFITKRQLRKMKIDKLINGTPYRLKEMKYQKDEFPFIKMNYVPYLGNSNSPEKICIVLKDWGPYTKGSTYSYSTGHNFHIQDSKDQLRFYGIPLWIAKDYFADQDLYKSYNP